MSEEPRHQEDAEPNGEDGQVWEIDEEGEMPSFDVVDEDGNVEHSDEDGAGDAADAADEVEELKARLQRLSADYQNYVMRSNQQAAIARDGAITDMARAMLTVLDHLDHALQVEVESADARTVLDGVKIVQSSLVGSLSQFGIERVDAKVGDAFDPDIHEALMRQSVEGIEPNHITMQMQPGYVRDGKTIRPAKVAVAE